VTAHRIEDLLEQWQNDPHFRAHLSRWVIYPEEPAHSYAFPALLLDELKTALNTLGIEGLYSHQLLAFEKAMAGKNLIINAGVGSGKSLCYHLPVLQKAISNPKATALYIFPTKALANDQQVSLARLIAALPLSEAQRKNLASQVVCYDGDTPTHQRKPLRNRARVLMTNPDMLHVGILPYHTAWKTFFSNLTFIVLDEAHFYRGVLGSHLANVIRRLKRIANFYGSQPKFILTSGTIANPETLANRLIEEPVESIKADGAPKPKRHVIVYNPPVVNPDLGIRQDALEASFELIHRLLEHQTQTVVFVNARRTAELALRAFREQLTETTIRADAYRSGYLPQARRAIEHALRNGEQEIVFATSALELGVDIGGVEAVVMVGYPGSVASTHQRLGRAGRRGQTSLGLIVTSSDPLNQYIAHHPEFILDRPPEAVIINPDNPIILLQHLECAAYEKPFIKGESFGSHAWEEIVPFLDILAQGKRLYFSADRFAWIGNTSPATSVSLRASAHPPVHLWLYAGERRLSLGEVDYESAHWMLHPGAIYLHQGQTFRVESIDFQTSNAFLESANPEYYTDPTIETTAEVQEVWKSRDLAWGQQYCGTLTITLQVTGYRKRDWQTHQVLERIEQVSQPLTLQTMGYWLCLSRATVDRLLKLGLWSSAPNDYGPDWETQRQRARARDHYTCQNCGAKERGKPHHVHHRVPFRLFSSSEEANRLENLVTLCPRCHKQAEQAVWIRSGLSALRHLLHHLIPLLILCDYNDIGSVSEPDSKLCNGQPALIFYDRFQGGLGYTPQLFERFTDWLKAADEVIRQCPCHTGCPSCVGPASEQGLGGKQEAQAILREMLVAAYG